MHRMTAAACGLLCLLLAGGTPGGAHAPPAADGAREILYVGTFDDRGSQGLYVFEFDRRSARLTEIQRVSNRRGPNFQAIHPAGRFLYSVSRDPLSDDTREGTISAYRIDGATGRLALVNERSTAGVGPAHVSVDPLGRFAYVSNYGSGNLSVFRIEDDGSLSAAVDVVQHEGASVHEQRQRGPHVHSAVPSADGRFLYVSDLGIDRVKIYAVERPSGRLTPAAAPEAASTPGAGPRHFAIHPGGRLAYSAEELSYTVAAYRVDPGTGALSPFQRVSMVPDGFEGRNSAADIHVSPDGRFLYASNRGHDSLVIYAIDGSSGALTLAGHEPTRGGHPRNFLVDERAEFVFVANRDADNVVVFRRDAATGALTFSGEEVHVPMAVCVTQLFLDGRRSAVPPDFYFPLPGSPGERILSEVQTFHVQPVVDGLLIPWGMVFLPDGRMLITERRGTLRMVREGRLLDEPVGGTPDVFVRNTGGLMDIALHPRYAENGWIYITYSALEDGRTHTALMRARLSGHELVDREVLFVGDPMTGSASHFGSRIVFRDGYVFFSTGDRGEPQASQDLGSHHGSIFRLFDDGRVPPDNPFVDRDGAKPEIYSYGHRNPQGLDFHPETGALWANEHGPVGGDELHVIEKGVNYGWPLISFGGPTEGLVLSGATSLPGVRTALYHWDEPIAPSALAFVTGDSYPAWRGDLMNAALRGSRLIRLVLDGERVVHEEALLSGGGRLRNVRVAPDGFLYVANETTGQILRLLPAAPDGAEPRGGTSGAR